MMPSRTKISRPTMLSVSRPSVVQAVSPSMSTTSFRRFESASVEFRDHGKVVREYVDERCF
jgi:hypothetical protein